MFPEHVGIPLPLVLNSPVMLLTALLVARHGRNLFNGSGAQRCGGCRCVDDDHRIGLLSRTRTAALAHVGTCHTE